MTQTYPRRYADDLPPKFTAAEREAYQWLMDCGVDGWLVDLLTKQVLTDKRRYESLVAFREEIERS